VRERQELVGAAFEGTDALVLVLGMDGRALAVNPAMTRATGWSEQELRERPFWELYVVPEDVAPAREDWARFVSDGVGYPVEGDWLDRCGGRRRISMQISVLHEAVGRPYAVVVVGVDVTEQRQREVVLRQRAQTDALTGVRNRAGLFEALTAQMAPGRGGGGGVLFCDVDGLKEVNDRLGHHAGDLVLVEVARRLRALTREGDVVARLGGDEFVVFCPGADEGRLAALAVRVHAALAEPLHTADGVLVMGASVGTALGRPGADPDEVLRSADERMYRMKTARRATRRR